MTSLPLSEAALFLDLDGTLAEIAPRPQDVGPDDRRTAVVRRACAALDGRVAMLSGRALTEIDRLVPVTPLCAAGSHGLERRDALGVVTAAEPHAALEGAAAAFEAFAAAGAGLLVERKPLSVALHWRQAVAVEGEALALARRLARETGLTLQEGHAVAELRTPGPDKGDALRAFMAATPFAGATPVCLGDDLTDEPAFEAAVAFGGFGMLVGGMRTSAALGRIASVGEAHRWLEASLDSGAFRMTGPWAG